MSIQSEINRLKQAVSDAFVAIGNKGGTVPSSKVSGNLSTAIQSIPSGVAVQRKSGTVVTDSNGEATVDCGFKPDLVYIHLNEGKNNEIYSTAAAFNEEQRTGRMNLIFWSYSNSSMYVEDMYIEQTDSGFSFELTWNSVDWKSGAESNMTVYYTAVKYT